MIKKSSIKQRDGSLIRKSTWLWPEYNAGANPVRPSIFMCASYWTIKKAKLTCKKCKKTSVWGDIQTHFMGGGKGLMCSDYYKLKEKIKALGNLSVTLDGKNDDFISECSKCGKYADIGAEIKKGKVVKMWTLN